MEDEHTDQTSRGKSGLPDSHLGIFLDCHGTDQYAKACPDIDKRFELYAFPIHAVSDAKDTLPAMDGKIISSQTKKRARKLAFQ
ncbi:MAG: hypothetical protein REI95_04345 [Oxalicibacterium faecigallinarum]|uniref:hypothetical protein n=1 Tax=Oxalicibacterium faecigallinarum TaxID=573741 RepID=UPI00280A47D1|nr:hypothetical protein [Oxalicibacterium faecigallinarum]MDQ7968852.1 hypothetical protein [Oxalicibacterium faecigallinarum]